MAVRIIDRQPFGQGGGVEGLIGRDQCHRAETDLLVLLADFKGGGRCTAS